MQCPYRFLNTKEDVNDKSISTPWAFILDVNQWLGANGYECFPLRNDSMLLLPNHIYSLAFISFVLINVIKLFAISILNFGALPVKLNHILNAY